MASIRQSIVSIILSITSDGKLYIVLTTRVENSASNVSRVMFNSRSCFLSFFLNKIKEILDRIYARAARRYT